MKIGLSMIISGNYLNFFENNDKLFLIYAFCNDEISIEKYC